MEKVALAGAGDDGERARHVQGLTAPLGTTDLAINYFECDPGEPIGLCYHRHHEQEEVFYVVSGTATFETEVVDVAVHAGALIRFSPGEWQQGWNRGDDRLAVLAIGAPRDEGPIDLRRACPDCGERTPAVEEVVDDALVFYCGRCGAETGRYP